MFGYYVLHNVHLFRNDSILVIIWYSFEFWMVCATFYWKKEPLCSWYICNPNVWSFSWVIKKFLGSHSSIGLFVLFILFMVSTRPLIMCMLLLFENCWDAFHVNSTFKVCRISWFWIKVLTVFCTPYLSGSLKRKFIENGNNLYLFLVIVLSKLLGWFSTWFIAVVNCTCRILIDVKKIQVSSYHIY